MRRTSPTPCRRLPPKDALRSAPPYPYEWDYKWSGGPEDVKHAGFELACLAVVLDDQVRLNALLERSGRNLPSGCLHPSMFVRLANTFLRIVWRHDVLSEYIDGSGDEGFNAECAGWVAFTVRSLGVDAFSRHDVSHDSTDDPARGQPRRLLYYRTIIP